MNKATKCQPKIILSISYPRRRNYLYHQLFRTELAINFPNYVHMCGKLLKIILFEANKIFEKLTNTVVAQLAISIATCNYGIGMHCILIL